MGVVLTDTEQIFYSCNLLSKREWCGTVRVLFTDSRKPLELVRREYIVGIFY